ncbi:FecR domain-containing protein [candidate division WOR-3 bacterium]|nr:FecR domain-containing protein [candidate division WOR-3 bacterium]
MSIIVGMIALSLFNAEVPAHISYMVGTVHIERGGQLYSGVLNAKLYVNDIVTTKDESECEIQFSNYSLVRLDPNSSIKIERKEETETGVFHRLFASIGSIITKVTKLNQGDEYELRTETAQAFIRGTTFKTDVDTAGTSAFSVFEGQVAVKSLLEGAKELLLDQNFKSSIAKDQLSPIPDQLSELEISEFNNVFKDFLDRGAALDELKKKMEEEKEKLKEDIEGKKDDLLNKGKGLFNK